jgi:hypothetical protein
MFRMISRPLLRLSPGQSLRQRYLGRKQVIFHLIVLGFLVSSTAYAADFEANLSSLVTAMTRKVFPILGLYYAAEAACMFVQGNPDAGRRIKTVGIGFVALIGINGAWSWLNGLIR